MERRYTLYTLGPILTHQTSFAKDISDFPAHDISHAYTNIKEVGIIVDVLKMN